MFFRDQEFDAEQHKAFARRFGEIFVHPNYKGMQADDEIVMIRREPGDQHIVGEDWHTDTTMVAAPPMGAILYAIEVPPYGGDTCFANQAAAYDALSPGHEAPARTGCARCTPTAWSPGRKPGATPIARPRCARMPPGARRSAPHPVVRTHPETGRKMLFVNHAYTVGFEGMTEAESRPLLDYLLEHGHRPEFTCRFRWENGSVAFWDNRAVKHLAVHDAGPYRRLMRRVQIAGDVPY